MGLIDSEEAAKRLARVIFSDIRLYNREKIQTGGDLKSEIEEGYNLFRSRVAPPLFPVFKQVMVDSGLRGGRAAPPGPGPTAVSTTASTAQPFEGHGRTGQRPAPPVQRPAPSAQRPTSPVQRPTQPVERAAQPVDRPAPPSQPAARPVPPGPTTPAPVLPPRRGRIDSEEAARRLARVIVSDIKIYNPGKALGDGALASQINDGRNLFRARVSPELAPLFEELLAGGGLVDTRRPAPPPAEATLEEYEALSPVSPPAPAFEDDMTDPHIAPPAIHDDLTPVPGRSAEQEPPFEEEFPEAPTLLRVAPPAAVAPAAEEWEWTWRELGNRLLTPISKIPRRPLVAALAAVAAVVGLIYYLS